MSNRGTEKIGQECKKILSFVWKYAMERFECKENSDYYALNPICCDFLGNLLNYKDRRTRNASEAVV